MNKKKFTIRSVIFLLLITPLILATDVNVSVNVTEHPAGSSGWADYLLYLVGQGTGNMFSAMGTPLMIFIILIALGSAIGYLLSSIGKGLED